MSTEHTNPAPGAAWIEIIRRPSLEGFSEAFLPTAVLEGSVLPGLVTGPQAIRRVFAATASMYESIAFTHETTQGSKTYLEWEGKIFGGRTAAGVTVLTRGADSKIESVRLMHRPLAMVVDFSAELLRRLGEQPAP